MFELFPDLFVRCVKRKVGLVFDMFLFFRRVRRKVGLVFELFPDLLFRCVRRKVSRASGEGDSDTGRTDNQLVSVVGCESLEFVEDNPNNIGGLLFCDILCLYLQ